MDDLRTNIIDTLSDKKIIIANSKLQKINNILSLDDKTELEIKKFLLSINIPSYVVDEIVDIIGIRFKYIDNFHKYIINRNLYIEDYIDKIIDLPELFQTTTKLDPDLIKWFMNLVWRTTPPSGVGEAALAILFNNCRKPTTMECGDVILNETEKIEVKGKRGCLVGTKSHGDAPSVGLYLARQLSELSGKTLSTSPIDYNFYKNKEWYIESIIQDIIVTNKSNKDDIVIIIAEALNLLYREATLDELISFIDMCIDVTGSIDTNMFIEELFIFSFNYYCKCEGFEYIALFNNNNIFIFKPHTIRTHIDKISYTLPSWSKRGGVQGKAFSITLR